MELFRSVRWRCSATLDPATLLDGAAFGRRTFLKGTTAVAGTLASLSAFGQLGAEACAQTPTFPVPAAARTPEGGLAAFVAKWQAAGPAIVLTRFGRFLSNRIFNCHVAGTPRAYNLFLGAAGATLAPGTNPSAHANLILDEGDWNGVLYGDFTGLAPLVAGRAFPSRDEANRAALLLIVMYIFAHIPAGADNDPAFLANLLRDLAARQGLPQCEGEQLPGAAPRVGGLDVPRPLGGIDRAGRAGGGRAGRRERGDGADGDRRRERDRGAGGRVPDRRAAHRERAGHPSARAPAAGGEAARSRAGRAPRRLRDRLHAAPGDVDPRLDGRREGAPHRGPGVHGGPRRPARGPGSHRPPRSPREPARLLLRRGRHREPAAARAGGARPRHRLALRPAVLQQALPHRRLPAPGGARDAERPPPAPRRRRRRGGAARRGRADLRSHPVRHGVEPDHVQRGEERNPRPRARPERAE